MSDTRPHIFFDLDGVLGDFDGHAKAQGKYDDKGKLAWDALDYRWYATMPVYDGAKALYDAACKLGVTKFLTGPILNEECYSGKARWIQNFVSERGRFILNDLIICPSGDKHYLARAGRILIDDRAKNIEEWVAAGGIGVHHTGDFAETLKKLKAAVAACAPKPAVTAASPMLVTVAGLSGSGKTTLAASLASQVPNAVHLDADVIRKEMFGVSPTTRLPVEAYTAEASQKLAEETGRRVRQYISEGKNVIVSAALLSQATRGAQELLAQECGARFVGIHLDADLQVLFDRVARRQNDASDAGVDIVKMQAAGNVAANDNWVKVNANQKPEAVLADALKVIASAGNASAKPDALKP